MLYLKVLAVLLTSAIGFMQALDKKKHLKIFLIVGVLFLFGTTVTSEFVTIREKKNQDGKLDELLTTNKELKGQVTGLEKKLDPFIKTAEKRYPDLTKEEALKKLQTDIEKIEVRAKILEEKVTDQKEQLSNYFTYAEVATWNVHGDKSVGSGVAVSSPVSGG